jgi:hypothetical protein
VGISPFRYCKAAAMNAPEVQNGLFEGAILFDEDSYRTSAGIVDFVSSGGKLGFVRQLTGYFRAEFLIKEQSVTFSIPVWDESRNRVLCATADEAKRLILEFVNSNDQR